MANYNTNLKTWGATGSEYPDGYNYLEGEQPVDEWDNFITSNLVNDIQHLIALTNARIESEYGAAGGEPNSPEESHLYHDLDNERVRVWDATLGSWYEHLRRDGDTMAGVLDMGGYQIEDSNGVLTLAGGVNVTGNLQEGGSDVATQNWVNQNADVPNADHADTAGDADTLDSLDSGDFARKLTGVDFPEYSSVGDVPSGITEGEAVYISGDGLYVEDGS
jgi:hypothetical protein